jgi:hypothetical protein
MKRNRWIAGCSAVGLLALAWPAPADATSALGGYTASTSATVVHIEVFEPVLPLPSSPQGDFSIGYTASTADSGPSTRALSSYIWPGSVIGDGFSQLTGNPSSTYPIQVDSRYPATPSSPAKNAIQITDGNGMSTSTDGSTTTANVTGLGIAGQGVNLLGGLGSGLGQLGGQPPSTSKPIDAPVPVSSSLAALVSAKGITSTSTVKVTNAEVVSTSTAAAADISVLSGVIGLSGIKVTNTVTSDGTKSSVKGTATIGGLTIAGVPIALGDQGIVVGKTVVKLPSIPSTLTSLLKTLGVELHLSTVSKSTSGASSTFSGQALTISIATKPLKQVLNGPLSTLINLLGTEAATQLAPIVELAPRIVLQLGDATTSLSASPAYNGGGTGTGTTTTGTGTGTTTTTTGTGGTTTTGGGGIMTGGLLPPVGGSTGTTSTPTQTGTPGTSIQPVNTAESLPGLGSMPRFLIVGALLLAAAIGWVMQAAGGVLLGDSKLCQLGLRTGVPDLRKE